MLNYIHKLPEHLCSTFRSYPHDSIHMHKMLILNFEKNHFINFSFTPSLSFPETFSVCVVVVAAFLPHNISAKSPANTSNAPNHWRGAK